MLSVGRLSTADGRLIVPWDSFCRCGATRFRYWRSEIEFGRRGGWWWERNRYQQWRRRLCTCLSLRLCVFALAGRCQGLESLLCFVSLRNSLHKGLYLSGRLLCILGGLGAHRSRVHHACVGSEPNIHGIFIDLRSGCYAARAVATRRQRRKRYRGSTA